MTTDCAAYICWRRPLERHHVLSFFSATVEYFDRFLSPFTVGCLVPLRPFTEKRASSDFLREYLLGRSVFP